MDFRLWNSCLLLYLQRNLTDSTVLRNMSVVLAHSILACRSTLQGIAKLQVCNIIQNYDACFLEGPQLSIHSAGVIK